MFPSFIKADTIGSLGFVDSLSPTVLYRVIDVEDSYLKVASLYRARFKTPIPSSMP
jgi:hypothetical protein